MLKSGANDLLITSFVKEIADLASKTRGAVFAYPTETFYGIGCSINDDTAVERIISVKGRDAAKGMIVLAADILQAKTIALINSMQEAFLKSLWPGALSVVLESVDGLNPVIAPEGRIAIRVSSNVTALELVKIAGPVISTSANPSGKMPACTVNEVLEYRLEIDAILDGGKTPGGLPSTLVDLTGSKPVCLRKGVIAFEDVLERWMELEESC